MTIKQLKTSIFILFAVVLSGQYAMAQFGAIEKSIRQEEYNKALSLIQKELGSDPKNDNLYYLKGKTYLAMKDYDEAQSAFEKGVNYGGRNPWNYIGLGAVHASRNNFEKTKENLDRALELDRGDNTDVQVAVAAAYLGSKEMNFMNNAETILYKVLAVEPENKFALINLGKMYELQGIESLALKNYRQAVSVDPKFITGWLKIGQLQVQEQNYKEAGEAFEKAIEINPQFAPAYKERGELKYKAGDYEGAVKDYEKYVELTDGDLAAQIRYVSFLYVTGKCEKAMPIMTDLKKDTNSVVLSRLIMYCNIDRKKAAEAAKAQKEYMAMVGDKDLIATDYEYMGKLHELNGEDSLAIEDYKTAVSMDSSKISIYKDLGEKLFKQKKYEKSAHFYEQFVQKGSPKFKDMFYRGLAYYVPGNLEMADSAFKDIIEKYNTVHIGYLYRGRVKQKMVDAAKDSEEPLPDSLAKPFYEKVYELLSEEENLSSAKKKDYLESMGYLGFYYYSHGENCEKAVPFFEKLLELDPEGPNAQGAKDVIEYCKSKGY